MGEWPTFQWNCIPPWILSPQILPQANIIPADPWPCCYWTLPLTPVYIHHWGAGYTSHNLWVTLMSCGLLTAISAPVPLLGPDHNPRGIPLLWDSPHYHYSQADEQPACQLDCCHSLDSAPRPTPPPNPSRLIILPIISPFPELQHTP